MVIHKFLQGLPSIIALVIASQKDLTLTQLGNLAEGLMPLINNGTVFATQGNKPQQPKAHSDKKKMSP